METLKFQLEMQSVENEINDLFRLFVSETMEGTLTEEYKDKFNDKHCELLKKKLNILEKMNSTLKIEQKVFDKLSEVNNETNN